MASAFCQKKAGPRFQREVLSSPCPCSRCQRPYRDLDPFFEKYQSIKPYLITKTPPPEEERKQPQAEHPLFEAAIRCILCACCTASCPINQNKETEAYVGPAALVRAFRYLFDSRDEASEERIALLDHKDGALGCQTLWKCTEVCPKEIPVTKQIGQIKRRIYESKKPK
jgi:succinate dehydrogenase / fumarate reductase iron-sulfur subunit